MTNIEKVYTSVKQRKSGFIWIGFGLLLLILAIPFMIYGIIKATANGVSYTLDTERKVRKLEIKNRKAELKQKHKDLKADKKQKKINAKRAKELNKRPATKIEEN